jgi:hypothetical protein
MIYRNKRPSQQPQGLIGIDWSNPITRGLVGAWTGSSPNVNLVTGTLLVNAASNIAPGRNGLEYASQIGGGSTSGVQLLSADETPTGQACATLLYRKRDTTNRDSTAFGSTAVTDANRFQVHLPYTDGIVYFDYGGTTSGSSRISVSGLTFGNDVWSFNNSPTGLQIWQNGILRASNSGGSQTRTSGLLRMFGSGWTTGGSDAANTAVFLVHDRALTAAEIISLSNNPWQIFKTQTKSLFFNTTAQQQTDGVVFRKKQWTRQPQTAVTVDWSNPLTSGLIVARIPGDNPAGNLNLVVDGQSARGRSSTRNGLLSTASAVASNSFSFLTLFKTQQSLGGAIRCLIGRGNSSGADNTGFGFNVDHSNAAYAGAFYAGDGYTIIGKPAGTLAANTEYCIAGTFNGSVGVGYSNGVKTVGPTSTTIVNTVPRLTLNTDSALVSTNTSSVYVVLYWARALSDAEIASVSNNPWQIFAPQKKPLFFSIQGTAGQTLTPSLFTNTNTFYSPIVTAGAVTLTPGLYTNSNTFYSPTVTSGAVTLTPDLFTNTNSFYSPTVTAGTVTLTPSLFTNSNTFYSAIVSQGGVILQPDLFTNTNSFYSATVTVGAVTLTPDLFTNTNSFYNATVTSTVTLTPDLYTNGQTFYTPTVTQGAAAQTLEPSLYENTNVFYSPTVAPGTLTLTPSLYENTNAFYSPTVVQATEQTILPDLFVNTNTFFRPTVDDGTRVISIADVGAEDERRKKRQKKRDKEFALLKQEQDKLRQEIERVIDPVVEQSQPVIVSPADREVRVLSVSGNKVAVTVPESLDVAQVAREIAQIFEQSRIKATIVERAAQTQQALAQAQEEYRRKMRRRRDDELLLLMD